MRTTAVAVDSQHRSHRMRRAIQTPRAWVVQLDQRRQCLLRHDLLHLTRDHRATCALWLAQAMGVAESQLDE